MLISLRILRAVACLVPAGHGSVLGVIRCRGDRASVGTKLRSRVLIREDFRLRKVPAGYRVAQRVGSGWELLSDVYESREAAVVFIGGAVSNSTRD